LPGERENSSQANGVGAFACERSSNIQPDATIGRWLVLAVIEDESTIGQACDVGHGEVRTLTSQGRELYVRRVLETGDKWILLIEDDEDSRESLVELLEQAGYSTTAVASGAAALEILQTRRPSLILADYSLDDMNGKELRQEVRASLGAEAPPFILLTGFSTLKDISGVILQKPVDCDHLLYVVAEHCGA
jgi:CheY-like chemotaxis protein